MAASRKRVLCLLVLVSVVSVLPFALNWWHTRPGRVFSRAIAAIQRGNVAQAQAGIVSLENHPENGHYVDCLKGAVLVRSGRFAEALRCFSRTRPDGEIRPIVLLLTGQCLYQTGRLVEAKWALSQLAAEAPQNSEAHRWLGIVYHDLGAMDAAIGELEAALRANPADWQPHALLAQIYFDVEQYAQAAENYRCVVAHRADPIATLRLAVSLVRLKKFRDALNVLEPMTRSAESLVLMAECHLALNDQTRAGQLLEEARSIDASSHAVLLLSARMSLDAQNPKAATEFLQQALGQDPHDCQTRYQLALSHRDQGLLGEYAEELSRFEVSQKLHDQYAELSRQARQRPNDSQVRDELCEVAQKLGKPEIARLWKRAADAFRSISDAPH
jgi:predicted Zn-dependent protease